MTYFKYFCPKYSTHDSKARSMPQPAAAPSISLEDYFAFELKAEGRHEFIEGKNEGHAQPFCGDRNPLGFDRTKRQDKQDPLL